VTTAASRSLPVVGQGIAKLDENKAVNKVLYVPGMRKNLLSVGRFADEGYLTLFSSKQCWIFDKHDSRLVILTGSRERGNHLYRLNNSSVGQRQTSSILGQHRLTQAAGTLNLATTSAQKSIDL
jgi:hypothetical protein